MIDTVKRFLDEHGLIRAGLPTCNIIVGRSLVFEVFQRPDVYITVKVSKNADLEREFECQRVAHAALPEYVPAPLAFGESKGLLLLASEGVDHAKLTAATMRDARERLACGMRDYARRSMTAFGNRQPTCGHYEDLEVAINSLNDRNLAAALAPCIQRVELEQIQLLPRIRQHGDLVASNVGVTTEGVVIFDWEDFGRVELPGFDIALLLMSCLDYNAILLKRWFELGEPQDLDSIITGAAGDFGVTRPTLWILLPVYLTHFLLLKRILNYRPSISELVRQLITDLCKLPHVAPGNADPR